MRKIFLALIAILLIGPCLVGCGSDSKAAGQDLKVCVGQVAILGVFAWAEVVEVPVLLSALPDCIRFVTDAFSLSSPQTSPVTADILNSLNFHARMDATVTLSAKYTYTSTVSGKVYSTVYANCNSFIPILGLRIPYSLSVKPIMGIGDKSDLRTYTSKTSEISSPGAVNRALFSLYGLTSQLTKSSIPLSIPPHKKMVLSVFATIPYKYGVAHVDDQGTISYLPWLLTTNAQPTIKVQSQLQNC